jgi:hypothetical protein
MLTQRPWPSPQERQDARNARNAQVMEEVRAAAKPSISYGGTSSARPVEKAEKARPGKRAPTKAERAWMDAIVAFGCVACRIDGVPPRPTAVHHIVDGGRRMGHLFTLGLCDPGHHQGGQSLGLISRHPWKKRFTDRYGSEEELLARLRSEIGALYG